MKFYSKDVEKRFQEDFRQYKPRTELDKEAIKYAPLAFKIARKVKLDDAKVGVFDKHDVLQSCFKGLVIGINTISQDVLNEAEDPDKTKINYYLASVERNLNRDLYRDSTGVSIPEYQIRKTKAELMADRLFGNWLYSFRLDDRNHQGFLYHDTVSDYEYVDKYEILELDDILSTELMKLSDKERDVLRKSYGLGYPKKWTMKDIAESLDMKVRGVEDVKKRGLNKLRNMCDEKDFVKFL